MLPDSDQFYLPNLYTFRNKNSFYGSLDALRFLVRPRIGEEDLEDALLVCIWTGEYCLEESEVLDEASFPLTDEGYRQLLDWLEQADLRVNQSRFPQRQKTDPA